MQNRKKTRGLVGRLLRRLEARIQRDRLQALSDHTLRDIGIVRDQIDEAVRGALDLTIRG